MKANPIFKSVVLFVCVGIISGCVSLSSKIAFKSEPVQADVTYLTKEGEKKSLGVTPIEMTKTEFLKAMGSDAEPGTFVTVIIQKPGFKDEILAIPIGGFGTLLTEVNVKLKEGTTEKELKTAKGLIEHLFLAQKFAINNEFDRAQSEIDRILIEFPNFARAMSMRASIFFAQKNYSESVKWYEKALQADPQMDEAVKLLAKAKQAAGVRDPASKASGP